MFIKIIHNHSHIVQECKTSVLRLFGKNKFLHSWLTWEEKRMRPKGTCWSIRLGVVGFLLFYGVMTGFAQESEKITTIHIVTPAWINQTQEDGSGLFFDIVRAVYEPLGIKMEFEIVPWERAMQLIGAKQADALLAVYSGNEGQIVPKYPLYLDCITAVFKKATIKDWQGRTTLNGKSAIWLRGYGYQDDFTDIQWTWSEIDEYQQAWDMLAADRVDIYLDTDFDIALYVKQQNIDMTPYQTETVKCENAYVGFAETEKSKKLIAMYDQRIPELLQSGELQKMFTQWGFSFKPFILEEKK
jgi:polar amino acid transport system substrate-binding protein